MLVSSGKTSSPKFKEKKNQVKWWFPACFCHQNTSFPLQDIHVCSFCQLISNALENCSQVQIYPNKTGLGSLLRYTAQAETPQIRPPCIIYQQPLWDLVVLLHVLLNISPWFHSALNASGSKHREPGPGNEGHIPCQWHWPRPRPCRGNQVTPPLSRSHPMISSAERRIEGEWEKRSSLWAPNSRPTDCALHERNIWKLCCTLLTLFKHCCILFPDQVLNSSDPGEFQAGTDCPYNWSKREGSWEPQAQNYTLSDSHFTLVLVITTV